MVDLIHWLKDIIHTPQAKECTTDGKLNEDSDRKEDSDTKSSSSSRHSVGDKVESRGDSKSEAAVSTESSVQAVEKLMQTQSLQEDKSSVNSHSRSSGGGGDSPCGIPFTVERIAVTAGDEPVSRYASPQFVVRFAVPSQ